MSNKVEWIDVRERLPEKPLDVLSAKEYLVTVKYDNEPRDVTTLFFIDKDHWETVDCETIHGVLAWAELPEGYKDPAKYRWRLNPEGYGHLRDVYLTAISPVLTVTEWDIAVDKESYKNVFTIDEYIWLSDQWEFNPGLFVKEELCDLDKERIEHD